MNRVPAASRPVRSSRFLWLALLGLVVTLPDAAAADGGVEGKLSADGQAIALAHGTASETTMGGADPVTFVRLTEKPVADGPAGDMEAISGKGGAMLAIHLHASGKVYQVIAVHPKADPTFPTDLPKDAVKVSDLRIADGVLSATVESAGEVRADGHLWQFRFALRLPVTAD